MPEQVQSPPVPPEGQPVQETAEAPEQEAPKIIYELSVSEDRLQARVRVAGEGPLSLTPEEVKSFLRSKKVSQGIVSDEKVREYIQSESILKEPCLLAEGKPPQPGKDAQVAYHFDKDPLKIGSIRGGGAIDFKNRGKIPQVIEGDLLGEKVPLVREKPGVDVFGKTIPAPPAKDILFFSGQGTRRSADGLKIYSRIRGRPELLGDGKICVFPEIRIQGDVGLVTGHIRFDGVVDVEGSIQEGYKVKAGRLAAREVFRSEVEADGDVVVDGGIVGARVVGRGNLKTRFIHSSQITVLGDVIVEREIIDSRIETNGALIAVNGRVFTSQVSAKKGVAARQVGSATSKPCTLRIGLDPNVEGMIKKMRQEIAERETEKKRVGESLERMNLASRAAKEKAVKYTQVQDHLKAQLLACRESVEGLNPGQDRARLDLARRELKTLEPKLARVEEELRTALAQEGQAAEKISAGELRVEELDGSIRALQEEIQKAREESQSKVKPPVKVTGQIYAGTMLEGCHSSQVMQESLEGVLIQETPFTQTTPEGEETSGWSIVISSL